MESIQTLLTIMGIVAPLGFFILGWMIQKNADARKVEEHNRDLKLDVIRKDVGSLKDNIKERFVEHERRITKIETDIDYLKKK